MDARAQHWTNHFGGAHRAADRGFGGADTQLLQSIHTEGPTPIGAPITVGNVLGALGLLDANGHPLAGNAFANLNANLPAFQLVQFDVATNLGGGAPQNTYSMATRIDYNLSDKTTLYGRWARESLNEPKGSAAYSPYAGFDTPFTQLRNNFIVSLSHTFSPNLVSDTKLAFNRLVEDSPYGDKPIGPGLFMFPGATGTIGGTNIAFPGYWPYNAASFTRRICRSAKHGPGLRGRQSHPRSPSNQNSAA